MSTEYIERGAAIKTLIAAIHNDGFQGESNIERHELREDEVEDALLSVPAADVEPVVRCGKCKHGVPFDRNVVLNSSCYLHCAIYRGEEVRNVWHKYKKYYRDYSVVDRDGFCDQGVAGEPHMDERSDA